MNDFLKVACSFKLSGRALLVGRRTSYFKIQSALGVIEYNPKRFEK
ncbi:hypothetical protein [Janthinobacterium sp. HLX7-2]